MYVFKDVCISVCVCVCVSEGGVCFGKVGASHSSTHLRFFLGSGGSNAANIASSNTFFSPFCEQKHTNRMREQRKHTHTHRFKRNKKKDLATKGRNGFNWGGTVKKQNTLKVIQRGFIRKRGSWWECKEKDKTTTKFPSRICNEQVRRLSCSVSHRIRQMTQEVHPCFLK